MDDGAYVYFTHSYAAPVTGATCAVSVHGDPFAAAVERAHVGGVQFHPEKSGDAGLRILRNFVALCGAVTERGSMLAKRIIACLDVRDGQVVKGVQFEELRQAGDPAALARRYNVEGIDELVILDITATLEKRQAMAATVRAVAAEIFIPLAVGGGIRNEADAEAVIEAGADKVSLNTAALADPALITRLAARYGSQAVVVAIDAKRAGDGYAVYVRSGTAAAARDAVEWAREADGPRRRRDPAHLDGSRRHANRVRLRDDRRGLERGADSRHRVRRRRHLRALRRRVHRRAAPTRRSRRPIFHYAEHSVADLKHHLRAARDRGADVTTRLQAAWLQPPGACRRLRRLEPDTAWSLEPAAWSQERAHPVHRPAETARSSSSCRVSGWRIEDADLFKWVDRFARFPVVQLIDLDAAIGTGSNDALVAQVCAARAVPRRRRHPHDRTGADGARIRRHARHRRLVALPRWAGRRARSRGSWQRRSAPARIIAAVDSRGGQVTIHGWRTTLPLTAVEAVPALDPFCAGFLCTLVDGEGLMQGFDLAAVRAVRAATDRQVIAAGGITTRAEIEALHALGVDAVVGMAIYTGRLPIDDLATPT